MINLYKTYNFIYNEQVSIEKFKEELTNKGIDTKQKFIDFVQKEYPLKSTATLGEYYSRRFCKDDDVLDLIRRKLGISLQDIFVPNSKLITSKVIVATPLNSLEIEATAFNFDNSLEKEAYLEGIQDITNCIGTFNYLLQKKNQAYLSNLEAKTLANLYFLVGIEESDALNYVDKIKDNPHFMYYFYKRYFLQDCNGYYLHRFYRNWLYYGDNIESLNKMTNILTNIEKDMMLSIFKHTNYKLIVDSLIEAGAKDNQLFKIDKDIADKDIDMYIDEFRKIIDNTDYHEFKVGER